MTKIRATLFGKKELELIFENLPTDLNINDIIEIIASGVAYFCAGPIFKSAFIVFVVRVKRID